MESSNMGAMTRWQTSPVADMVHGFLLDLQISISTSFLLDQDAKETLPTAQLNLSLLYKEILFQAFLQHPRL